MPTHLLITLSISLFLQMNKPVLRQDRQDAIYLDSTYVESELRRASDLLQYKDSATIITLNAHRIAKKTGIPSLSFKTKLLLANRYVEINDFKTSSLLFNELKTELDTSFHPKLIIDYHRLYAWFIGLKGETKESIALFEEAIVLSKTHNNYRLDKIYLQLSSIQANSGYFIHAIQNRLKARTYAQNNINNLTEINSQIGALYLELKIYDKAQQYFNEALSINPDHKITKINSLYGLGLYNFEAKNNEEAYTYFQKVIELVGQNWIYYYQPTNSYLHYWKCSTLLEKNNHKELGLNFINNTNELLKSNRTPYIGVMQAEILIFYDRLDEAEKVLKQGLKLVNSIEESSMYMDYYYWLSVLFEKKKKYKQAFHFHKAYKIIDDSLRNKQILNRIAILQEEFEATERETEIASLNNQVEKERLETQLSKSRLRNFSFSSVAILLIATTLMLYYRNRQKFNFVRLQAEKESKENEIQRIIEQSKSSVLRSNLQGQEKERARLAKELHDDLGSRLTALCYFVSSKKGIFKGDDEKLLKTELKSVQKYIRNVSHQLARPQFSHYTLPQLILEQKNWINGEEIEFEFYNNPEINWEIIPENHQNEMYRIVQEAVTNTIKHAQATKLQITIDKSIKGLEIQINDNGQGISESNISGMGIKNIQDRAKAIGGQLIITSEYNNGTQIKFLYQN